MDRPPPWSLPDPLPLPLQAPRLIVDGYREEDAPALFDAVSADRAALLPWLSWVETDHRTEEESLARIHLFSKERGSAHPVSFPMGIFDREQRGVLGGTGFVQIDSGRRTADIGYWIRPDRHGEGLCTEAVGRLITSAFRDWGLRRITIGCEGSNRASQRVAEKLGLRHETREVRSRWLHGHGWRDHLGYAVLADEWDPVRHRGPTP